MRSGTHLTIDLLRRQFEGVGGWKFPGEANDSVYLPLDSLRSGSASLGWPERRIQSVLRRSGRVVCKTHWTRPGFSCLDDSQPALASWLRSEAVIFLVVRHPQKVAESIWRWQVSQGPLPPDSAVGTEWVSAVAADWREHIELWHPNVTLVFRTEDTLANTSMVLYILPAVLDQKPILKTPLLPPRLAGKWHSRWNRIFAWRPDSTEIIVRSSGRPFPWSSELLDACQFVAGDWMEKLGYRCVLDPTGMKGLL